MQKQLERLQNPRHCAKARYFVYTHVASGMGSNLHLAASAFAKAINAGRVLVFSSPERDSFIYRDSKRCGDSRGWDCWFEPVSKCVPDKKSDVWYGQGHAHGKRKSRRRWETHGLGCDPKYGQKGCGPFAVNGINETWIQTAGGAYPFRFQALLECSNVHPLQYPYWWSAQAVAYLMRFTDRTRKEIDELRATKVLHLVERFDIEPFFDFSAK